MLLLHTDFLGRLKKALEIGSEHGELRDFSVETGHDILLALNLFIRRHPNKFYQVRLVYEILSGKDRRYFRTNNFRTLCLQNVSCPTSTTHEGIYADVEKFIFDRGEIYFPDDPYKINFNKISIKALNKTFRRNERSNRLKDRFFSSHGILRMERVQGLIDALYYLAHREHPGFRHSPHVPVELKQLGLTSMTQFDDLDIDEQLRIFDQLRLTRKNSFFKHKTVKLYTHKDKLIQDWDPNPNIVHLYMSTDLYIIVLDPLDNVNLDGTPIRIRNTNVITDAIYVMYDTEWSWILEGQHKSISKPNLLTYCIVHVNTYVLTEKNYYQFKTEYILGTDCVLKFLEVLTNLVNTNKNRKIYAIAHNATEIEHTFVINAITEWFATSPNYELVFTHVDGAKVKSFIWRTVAFRDSLLFLPLALSKIGKALDLDVEKLDIDPQELQNAQYEDPNFEASEQGQRIIQYARNDSLVLAKAIMKFMELLRDALQLNYLIDFMNFLSSSSIIKWWLIDPDGELCWDGPDFCKFRNTVFLGGRNECYYKGTDQDFINMRVATQKKMGFSVAPENESEESSSDDAILDTNSKLPITSATAYAMAIDMVSSYPHSMCSEALPGDPISITKPIDYMELKSILSDPTYIYGVYGKLKMKKPDTFPLIGVKQLNKLVFPNFMTGASAAFMWDFEIRAIYNNIDTITDIIVITFKKYTKIQPKIKQLFEGRQKAKQEGNVGLAFVYKILMNSGYGSLGLNYMRERAHLAKGTYLTKYLSLSPKMTTYEGPNGFTWVVKIKETNVNSKIFMASYITAMSRYLLWQEMRRLATHELATILYCDTDSIIFVDKPEKEQYYRNTYTGKELGSWKFEQSANSWEIATLKVYRLGNTIKYKGISSTNNDLLTPEGRITKQTDIEIWSVGRDAAISVSRMTKYMSLAYTKGFVWPNGLITPLTI